MTSPDMGRGVLHPAQAAAKFQLSRHPPGGAAAPFVDYYWIVRWDLRGEPDHEQKILPHPNVHLVFEAAGSGVHGVDTGLFVRRITGRGQVLGVRFHPGGFRPFWDRPVARLTDLTLPAAELFGPSVLETERAILAAPDEAAMVAHAEAFLAGVLPARDPVAEEVAALVARIVGDPGLTRVDRLAEVLAISPRRLQRLFVEYVGVSPKWVLRRARLHEAAERADGGQRPDWAELASDLGYSDQAHLTRDFSATIGAPPARYATMGAP